MTLDEWLASANVRTFGSVSYRDRLPKLVCADGTELSVQAGHSLYCMPRNNAGPWTHVEVGYPSTAPGPLWTPYAEEPDSPTNTVYAYVPIEFVCLYIAAHGGLQGSEAQRD